MQKIIRIAKPDKQLQLRLSGELSISPILAQVLINRGIKSAQDAREFLEPKLADLLSPWQMKDMEPAVKRIIQAGKKKEKVLIFGDYDVDGISSVVLLKTHLERLGIPVTHYIPHRVKEGYGLSQAAEEVARNNNIKVIVTADCGINSCAEIKKIRRWGIDVIVTDHHEPQGEIPPAYAIINPKRRDCPYRFKHLSGVGVVYKFIQALSNNNLWEELDLVALGTIADSVALTGENRIIAREGLKRLSVSPRPGIQALMDVAGINRERPLKSFFVSYVLAPRINASGRVDTAESALSLLLSQSDSQAEDLAKLLNSHNRKRQKIEEKILNEAKSVIDKEINFKQDCVIVVSGQHWHTGVLGIVASRLAERYYRPTILISETTQGLHCRGSARSIKDFSIFDALAHCSKHLENFGGHRLAAGLTISKKNIRRFREEINDFGRQFLLKELLLPSIDVDMEVGLGVWEEGLVYQLKNLEPFGSANPQPVFFTRNITLRGQPQVLNRGTLKFWVTDSKFTYPVIAFGLAGLRQQLVDADSFSLLYHPEIDTWQDNHGLILRAKDIIFDVPASNI
ncbi:single-stranded-DNA-specific exonuclease RecJ [Candidatus Omnitrophota bacterium]